MANSWIEFLKIKEHEFLQRFRQPSRILALYEPAIYGLPRLLYGRPKHWYDRARSTNDAIDRLGEFTLDQLNVSSDPADEADLLRLLEDCEEPGSIDLIERIFAFYPRSPFDPPPPYQGISRHDPATEAQRRFLKRLGIQNFSGTKDQASRRIDQILAERDQTR